LEDALKTLRYCISAGEHLPEAIWRAWHERTGIAITDGIGATEMMHIFVSAAGDDIRPGATGKAVPGYEATVLGADGKPIDEGVGRLAVKGPTGCRYLDDPRQRDYVENGWNVTGDTYRRDADGYYWYLARSDDMIVSAGYNIGAPEVENALLSHPAVAECAVIGVPCPERGQKVKAFVVLAADAVGSGALVAELQAHAKAQIAPYKYPREIEFVDTLPKTATGKLRRSELRNQIEEVGMPEQEISSAADELARTFERTWNDRDGIGYGTAYWSDAELVDPMGQIWDGREAIVQMHLDLWAGPFSKTAVRARVRRVRKIAPTAGVIDLEISGTGFPLRPDQPSSESIIARLKHVVEKRDGQWKIAASQNTFVVALS
jgi:uncharacterized protein (TIGR02246 family)